MAVYVDDAGIFDQVTDKASNRKYTSTWSHLSADTSEELLEFATKELKLKPEWIQHKGTALEHFDVTESKRKLALAKGATPITWKQMGWQVYCKTLGMRFDPHGMKHGRAK